MSSIQFGILLIGGGTLCAVLGLVLVRRHFKVGDLEAHHEVAGYLLSILGTLYAVVLGFVVVSVSNDVLAAKQTVAAEVNSVLNMYRMADGLPKKNFDSLSTALISYCDAVVDDEWTRMAKTSFSVRSLKAMNAVWASIQEYSPDTAQHQAFYAVILDNYGKMLDGRRLRLIRAYAGLSPVLWAVLVIGAMTTIGFTYFFGVERLDLQIVMTVLVSITLLLNLFLVVINSRPFAGEFGLRPTAFKIAREAMRMEEHSETSPGADLDY